ncbi:Dyp-type peroxidase [Nocardia aurantia]|uniref:Deferrochelatase/peroxidase EfeB n=1 Tax=Nocardia aurantia TaxID=2585199 RepID=A0A7K0DVR7_9NOCA|nr:Dyp-type peroxidase [Nocardia aurantia]MQY29880.1 Deferrochelatase/peroxidase EfeB [Nocardia aurantia]
MVNFSFDRRAFLRGAVAAGVGGAVTTASAAIPGPAVVAAPAQPFHGMHQAGIEQAPAPGSQTVFTAYDVTVRTVGELVDLLRALTDRARRLTGAAAPVDVAAPAPDDGVLGPDPCRSMPTVTVGFGASLFERFGLAGRRPAALAPMPVFPNDRLQPAWCHGDLSVQLNAADLDTCVHALRDLGRATRGGMRPRWRIDGFVNPPRPDGSPRNLLGFKDGSGNPTRAEFDRLIWTGEDPGPAWTTGGSYLVIRLIRMLVESWDRLERGGQERILGRDRDTGAPLDGARESDEPDYTEDPEGVYTPLNCHIRRANPRTPDTVDNRILRRAFNYDHGVDEEGDLDQGLVFVCYQRDPRRQFEAIQRRLADEPLTSYIRPFGGGYFFVPPGVRDESDFYGRALVT